MIAKKVQTNIDAHVDTYFYRITSGEWTLAHAHSVLTNPDANKLDLFQIAALAKAIAICQCADEAGIEY